MAFCEDQKGFMVSTTVVEALSDDGESLISTDSGYMGESEDNGSGTSSDSAEDVGTSSKTLDAVPDGVHTVDEQDEEDGAYSDCVPSSNEDFKVVSKAGLIEQEGGKPCHEQHTEVQQVPESVSGHGRCLG
ncbi:hypothetical protein GOP47_0004599 [Adiantum capillus-veneris]|uniref:Uncharacterized protein n=1 Tax=Adiantum capillus-veneris TaxID=13818 RepID=A0A9D4ZPU6_ADICA|nr:hypothetical protein GOP47_0004599 [Adiantum capillus-veneris]